MEGWVYREMNSTESGARGMVEWEEGGSDEQEAELQLIMGLL